MLELFKEAILKGLPGALITGVLVPGVSYLWKHWRAGRESQVRGLRERIGNLNDFLRTAADLGDSPEAHLARVDAIKERDALLAALARLSTLEARTAAAPAAAAPSPSPPSPTAAPQRRWFRRAFLLHSPTGVLGWAAHTLFFVSLVAAALGGFAVVSNWSVQPESPSILLAVLGVWGSFAALGRALATVSERPVARRVLSRGRLERWLLLYRPKGALSIALHVVFYLLLLVVIVGTVASVATLNSDPEAKDALLGMAILTLVLLTVRWAASGLARRSDR